MLRCMEMKIQSDNVHLVAGRLDGADRARGDPVLDVRGVGRGPVRGPGVDRVQRRRGVGQAAAGAGLLAGEHPLAGHLALAPGTLASAGVRVLPHQRVFGGGQHHEAARGHEVTGLAALH